MCREALMVTDRSSLDIIHSCNMVCVWRAEVYISSSEGSEFEWGQELQIGTKQLFSEMNCSALLLYVETFGAATHIQLSTSLSSVLGCSNVASQLQPTLKQNSQQNDHFYISVCVQIKQTR